MPVRLVLAAAILALTACQVAPVPGASTPTPTPAGSAEVGGTFRVALTGDPTTLDPWNANDANTLLVTRQIFETLVDYTTGGASAARRCGRRSLSRVCRASRRLRHCVPDRSRRGDGRDDRRDHDEDGVRTTARRPRDAELRHRESEVD